MDDYFITTIKVPSLMAMRALYLAVESYNRHPNCCDEALIKNLHSSIDKNSVAYNISDLRKNVLDVLERPQKDLVEKQKEDVVLNSCPRGHEGVYPEREGGKS